MKNLNPQENKFHKGNGDDGKHYWLTPPALMKSLQLEFEFDFDACPYPKPDDFDGLSVEWGKSTYVNPPFGSVWHQGPKDNKPKKKGMTAWVRKAIEEHQKGKRVVMVYPIDKWILMLIKAGAIITNLGDVKWVATEDGSPGKGTGRHIAQFVLEPEVLGNALPINEMAKGGTYLTTTILKQLGFESQDRSGTNWQKGNLKMNIKNQEDCYQYFINGKPLTYLHELQPILNNEPNLERDQQTIH